MARGEYKLAIQSTSGCAFAWIVLEARDVADPRFVVDTSSVDEWWRDAVAFGVRYAHETLVHLAPDRGKQRVVVESLRTSNVDSNVMAVAFASYHAACIAFGITPDDRVRLRRPELVYEFPGIRLPAR